jgi:hypothetical protein
VDVKAVLKRLALVVAIGGGAGVVDALVEHAAAPTGRVGVTAARLVGIVTYVLLVTVLYAVIRKRALKRKIWAIMKEDLERNRNRTSK